MELDRRAFLKGLLGVTAIVAIAAPELAEAARTRPKTSWPKTPYVPPGVYAKTVYEPWPIESVDWATGSITLAADMGRSKDRVTFVYSADPETNSIVQIAAIYEDGRRQVVRRPADFDASTVAHYANGEGPLFEVRGLEVYQTRWASSRIDVTRKRVTSGRGRARRDEPTRPRYTWPSPRRSRRR